MENVMNYCLYENKLTTEDPDDYYAMPVFTGTVTDEDLIEEMTSPGSTLTKGEAKLFIEQYRQAIRKKLLAGYGINTGLFNITPRIVGVFKGKNDTFDLSRHAVNLSVNPGVLLKAVEPEFKLAKVEATRQLPEVLDFMDVASKLANQLVTIGGVGHITGRRLAFDEADPNQGIFFVAESLQAVKVTTMVRLKPSELIFMIPPALQPGTYFIEVRNIPKGNKDLRTGRSQFQVTAR